MNQLNPISNGMNRPFLRIWEKYSGYLIGVIALVAICLVRLFYKYALSRIPIDVSENSSNIRMISRMRTNSVEALTELNRRNIREGFYVTKILFHGSSGSGQEIIARKMAHDLNLKFHCFDGLKLKDHGYREKMGWYTLFQRLSSSEIPEFVFVSNADDICRNRKINDPSLASSMSTILGYSGQRSKTVLLCLGVNSLNTLDPAIYSEDGSGRYQDLLYVPSDEVIGFPKDLSRVFLPNLDERISLLQRSSLSLPKILSREEIQSLGKKMEGFSKQTLWDVLLDISNESSSLTPQKVKDVIEKWAIKNKINNK